MGQDAQVALFEDERWRNFAPLTLTRAAFDVKVGARSFFEEYPERPKILLAREHLARVTLERHPGCIVNPESVDASSTVFVNGLLHPGAIDVGRLLNVGHTFAITFCDGDGRPLLVAARLSKKDSERLLHDCILAEKEIDPKRFDVEKSTELKGDAHGLLLQPWDIIRVLENALAVQVASELATGGTAAWSPDEGNDDNDNNSDNHLHHDGDAADHLAAGHGARVVGSGGVAVGRGAEIEEGTVLDTRKGGIYIGPRASIAPSRIVGPAYIGAQTQVKQFSIIESSFVGFNCRVAGEIEHSVISDHTNKAHAGFVGHSYIGEWVNVGAMSTTSDLKMTYGDINMALPSSVAAVARRGGGGKNADRRKKKNEKEKVSTGLNKVGSFVADMAKTSIGTLIYSGKRIGVSSHLHGLVSDDVPSFTIYGAGIGAKNAELEVESAIETQKRMMSRRGIPMSKGYEQMVRDVFAMTAAERRQARVRRGKFAV